MAGDDGSDFETATTPLLDAFEEWQRRRGVAAALAAEVAAEAGLALDWKWSYADGNLRWWRTEHLAEFLLEWCPRKLSAPAGECRSIPATVAAFVAFLDDAGLLAPGSSPLPEMQVAAASLTGEFVDAMGDPSHFGLAKSLIAAAEADGVDLADPSQMEEWIEAFNAGPEDERRRILPDQILGSNRPVLPPVALPDDADVEASRAAAPVLAMFAKLAGYVGAGRPLTQKGHLTLADARALVPLLGTGDVIDLRIGDRTFKTRSSAELPVLCMVFAWARKAGVLRVAHGKVIATKKAPSLGTDPAAWFDKAVDALLAVGPLSCQRAPNHWFSWPEVDELLDRFTVHLLAGPYAAQRPLALEDMAGVAAGVVLDGFEFPALDDDRVTRRVTNDLTDVVDALELAGVVVRTDVVDAGDVEVVGHRRSGGSVALTPAGVVTTRRLLQEAGYEAPAAGRFAAATATELLVGADASDFGAFMGEMEAWKRRRTPAEAVQQLAEAVVELDDPGLSGLALAVLGDIDAGLAAPEVRKLTAHAPARGFALCWLVDHGFEEEDTLFAPDDPGTFVDVLAHRLVVAGPDALAATLALAGNHEAQVALLGRLWRSPSPGTEVVLAALGQTHPVKAVAKAARKALFQRRSWAVR